MTTPADRLAKLRELREAASPGPWVITQHESPERGLDFGLMDANEHEVVWNHMWQPNAKLAAQAPALAASVEALGAALEKAPCERTAGEIGCDYRDDKCYRCEALTTIPKLEEKHDD